MTKIIVKKHKRKTKRGKVNVKKHKRKIKSQSTISSKKRKLLDDVANRDFEVGGYMDFEKGKGLENVKMHFGSKYALEFDEDPDYEVQFHSHPNVKYVSVMPSFDDIVSMKGVNQREQLIFNKKVALSIYETDKFNNVPPGRVRGVLFSMQRDFDRGMNDRQLFRKYKPVFKQQLGLEMTWHEKNKPIKLKSRMI